MKIGLIGLGAIGTPIADKLNKYNHNDFYIIAGGHFRESLEKTKMYVNGIAFFPNIATNKEEIKYGLDLFIVCVKNYDLEKSIKDFQNIISEKTIILPLQNGIYAYEFFKKQFPDNIVLKGYVQGPNTTIDKGVMNYQNSGKMHIGSETHKETAENIYKYLKNAGLDISFEKDINRQIWKKWMLNVAGNSITALTEADYSMFKYYPEIQTLCIHAMEEFKSVANAEGVDLSDADIKDVIDYYINYVGGKKTSMLVDVLNKRKTENEYLAGQIMKLAEKNGIKVPIIQTLYYLLTLKEAAYSKEE